MSVETSDFDQQTYEFSQVEFRKITALAREEFGLNIPPEKKRLVYSRLGKRLRALSLNSFSDYYRLIQSPDGGDERNSMLSALTTNTSHFFREPHHFELLERDILPGLIARARSGGRVRIWSAGCSAGQETYSIAFSILKLCPEAGKLNIKILATDVDKEILKQAREGIYEAEKFDKVDASYRDFFVVSDDEVSISAAARNLISFTTLNLVGPWPKTAKFDVIFCRNVAIYFDQDTQSRLWPKFSERMDVGGLLFIGHSERLSDNVASQFKQIGTTAFAKLASSDAPYQNGAVQ